MFTSCAMLMTLLDSLEGFMICLPGALSRGCSFTGDGLISLEGPILFPLPPSHGHWLEVSNSWIWRACKREALPSPFACNGINYVGVPSICQAGVTVKWGMRIVGQLH